MSSGQPSFRPRPGGGFNPGMGGSNEHMDESAMQSAVQQKALSQQASQPNAQQIAQQAAQNQQQGASQAPPREIGTIGEELLVRPAQDLLKGLASIFDLNAMLGLSPAQIETPEEKAKKQQTLQRFNKLTEEDQAYARRKYQERLKQKEAEEQEKEQKRQIEAQKSQEVIVPSSTKKGPEGPSGNKKKQAVTKLQNDRKTLSGPSSVN